ncbi:MAG TPA: sigma factor, partial [Pedobacter sp.]
MLALLLPAIVVKDQPRLKKGHLNETVIVAALVAGDTRALEKLYAAYSAALLGIISRIIKHEDLAEDILQETFLKIWKSIDKY